MKAEPQCGFATQIVNRPPSSNVKISFFSFEPPFRVLLPLLLPLLSVYENGNGREGKCNYGIIKWFHRGNYEPFNARWSLQLSAYRTCKQAKWFKQ